MSEHKITTTISTNNNLEYLKLAIKSVRQNCYYNDMPIIVHAENCTDGTDNWLDSNFKKYDLLFKKASKLFGPIDYFIHAAGVHFIKPIRFIGSVSS